MSTTMLAKRLGMYHGIEQRIRADFRLARVLPTERLHARDTVRRHLVLAARLTQRLDAMYNLWVSSPQLTNSPQLPSSSVDASHPIVTNSTSMELDRSHTNYELCETTTVGCDVNVESVTPTTSETSAQPPPASSSDSPLKGSHSTQQQSTKPPPFNYPPPTASSIDLLCGSLSASATLLNALAESPNPLLSGLTEHFVDEGCAEEEVLLNGKLVVFILSINHFRLLILKHYHFFV
ncbi:unnamed protein product [Protopolystoma xenopodis]|uniref:Uncharacterized protein n=1 Tax=Protopolystoma xenopodis TaxID=117903 RepID=A0A448WRS0_9PLAT|nr:unnamed protein product [Protopolystoma xenopodis]